MDMVTALPKAPTSSLRVRLTSALKQTGAAGTPTALLDAGGPAVCLGGAMGMDGLAVPITPFALGWGRPELWPHGLAVLCPEVVPEALQQLHTQLGQALQQRGLRTDSRPFRPHLTLARHAQAARLPAQGPVFNWPVAGYALVESTGQAGQRYRVLQSYGPVV